jgi:hypothetical protein
LARVELPPFNDSGKRRTIQVTSTHHQMMIPTEDAVVLLTANIALEKNAPAYTRIGRGGEKEPDTEAVWYQDTNSLCFQPHPEFGSASPDCVDFFEECLENFVYPQIPTGTKKAILNQIPVEGVK